jgi:hypothetical protein
MWLHQTYDSGARPEDARLKCPRSDRTRGHVDWTFDSMTRSGSLYDITGQRRLLSHDCVDEAAVATLANGNP